MVQNKLPLINSAHGSETRNIINKIIKAINDRGLEILSESGFLTWLDENGIKHREEVQSFNDLPSNDSLNTVRGVVDDNKIYIKKESGWLPFQTIDISKINQLEYRFSEDIDITKNNEVFIESFERIAPEVNDSGRIQRAIDSAGMYGMLKFKRNKVYSIGTPLKPMNFQTWECDNVIFEGDFTKDGISFKGTSTASNSSVTIKGLIMRKFNKAITMETTGVNGCYYNNFDDLRIYNCNFAYSIGSNCNINNITNNTFMSIKEKTITIGNTSYKNNINSSSFEGDVNSIGIDDKGSFTSITGNYFEALNTAIKTSTGILIGNYYSSSITNKITGTRFTTLFSNDNSYNPFLQLGNGMLKVTGQQIILEDTGSNLQNFTINLPTTSKNKLTIENDNPDLTIRKTGSSGSLFSFKIVGNNIVLTNNEGTTIGVFSPDGNFRATKGINGSYFTTANRPSGVGIGTTIVDTSIQKLIWWNGTAWKDAMGNIV